MYAALLAMLVGFVLSMAGDDDFSSWHGKWGAWATQRLAPQDDSGDDGACHDTRSVDFLAFP